MNSSILSFLEQGNGIMLLGVLLLAAALALLARLVASIIGRAFEKKSILHRRIRTSWLTRVFQLTFILLLASSALAMIFAGAAFRAYRVFTREDLVAKLECLDWNPEKKLMVVRLTVLDAGRNVATNTYDLTGDQWEVNAHILKWHPNAHWLGLHTVYRLNMIKGVYQDPDGERRGPHQAYALSAHPDWIWGLLANYGDRLPWVQAVYGNAVSNFVQPGEQYDIFVTTSGLSARRARGGSARERAPTEL